MSRRASRKYTKTKKNRGSGNFSETLGPIAVPQACSLVLPSNGCTSTLTALASLVVEPRRRTRSRSHCTVPREHEMGAEGIVPPARRHSLAEAPMKLLNIRARSHVRKEILSQNL